MKMIVLFILSIAFIIIITSCGGNFATNVDVNVSLNVTPFPEIAGNTVQINIAVYGMVSVGKIEIYNMDDLINVVYSNSASFSWTVTYGDVKIIAKVYDTRGILMKTVEFPKGDPVKTKDGIKPSVSISFIPSEDLIEPNDTVDVKVEVEDDESGIDETKVYLYIDGERIKLEDYSLYGKKFVFTYNWIATQGKHQFYAIAYDKEGNMGMTSKRDLMIGTDDIPPSIIIYSSDTVQPNTSFDVEVYVFDDESGVESIRVYDSFGNVFEDYIHPPEHQVNKRYEFIAGDEGVYSITIEAKDNMGNKSQERKDINVSMNKPPHITLYCPKKASQGETIRATADVWDEDGEVIRVEFYIDDDLIDSIENPPYVVSWNAEAGKHTIKATAYDNFGNNSSAQKSIYVSSGSHEEDKNPPVIMFNPEQRHPLGELRNLVALISDDTEVSKSALFDDGEYISDGIPISGSVYRFSWTPTKLGTHTLTVVATDVFGNTASVFAYVDVLTPEEYRKPVITSFFVDKHILGLGDEVNVTVGAKDDKALDYADLYVRCGEEERRVDSEEPDGYIFNLKWIADCMCTTVPIKVIVYDVDGNYTQATDVLSVYNAPVVEFVQPAPPGTSVIFRRDPPISITFIASVTDPSSPSTYSFDITGPKDYKLIPIIGGSAGSYIFIKDWTPDEPGNYTVEFNYENERHIHVSKSIYLDIIPQTNVSVVVTIISNDILNTNPSVATVVARNYDTGDVAEDATLCITYSNGVSQIFTNPLKLGNGVFKFEFPLTDDPNYDGKATLHASAVAKAYVGGAKKDVVVDLRDPRIDLDVYSTLFHKAMPVFSDLFKIRANVENVSYRDVDKVVFSMDGQIIGRISGDVPVSTSSNLSVYETDWINPYDIGDGAHSVIATAVDLAGNTDTDHASILIDTTAPTVLKYWVDGYTEREWKNKIYGNGAKLNILVGDYILSPSIQMQDIPELMFKLNNVVYIVESSESPGVMNSTEVVYKGYNYTLNLPTDDVYDLSFEVKDIAGNSTIVNTEFCYDTQKPILAFLKPYAKAKVGQSGTDVVLKFSDNLSGFMEYKLYISNDASLTFTSSYISSDGLISTISYQLMPNMNIEKYATITVKATDMALNCNSSSVYIFMDTKKPRIHFTKPNMTVSEESTKIELNVTDLGGICDVSSSSNFGTLDFETFSLPATSLTIIGTINDLSNLETDVTVWMNVTDCLGNNAQSSKTFFVDTLAPRLKESSTNCTCALHATVNLVLLDMSDLSTIVATWTDVSNTATSMHVAYYENDGYEHGIVLTATLTTECSTPATVDIHAVDVYDNATNIELIFKTCGM